MNKILVVGAGQMGAGIAQVAAQAGNQVTLIDTFVGATDKGLKGIQKSLEKLKEKGLLKEDPAQVMGRIQGEQDFNKVKAFSPDLVIEAVPENFEIKAKVFRELDLICPSETIFASNTSSINITQLAAQTKRPHQFVGMHFMNPVPLMKLVEMIKGLKTTEEVFQKVKTLAEKMGKTVVVSQDKAGFIINRILMPMINEAVMALGEGLATKEDIDNGMKLGTNQPMGPLTLADFIGLDTCLSIMNVLYEEFADSKYRPAPLLKQYVRAGLLGKKTGEGFYKY